MFPHSCGSRRPFSNSRIACTVAAGHPANVYYRLKDGIVYDAKKLLADVGAMVATQKKQRKPG